jgi:hypothetical protein
LLASSAATLADPHCFSEDSEAVARQMSRLIERCHDRNVPLLARKQCRNEVASGTKSFAVERGANSTINVGSPIRTASPKTPKQWHVK